jgi:hypothetical protein
MLASISPFGERARGNRWTRTVTWYLAGSVAGGAVTGGIAGALGVASAAVVSPSPAVLAGAVVVASAAALAVELGAFGWRTPTTRRQVDEDWIARYRSWLYASGFGFQLGLGVATIVTTTTVYLMVVLAALCGSVAGGIAIGATFGIARALPMLLVRHADDPGALRGVLRTVHRQDRVARWIALGTLAVLTALALAAGAG